MQVNVNKSDLVVNQEPVWHPKSLFPEHNNISTLEKSILTFLHSNWLRKKPQSSQ